jgi:hypothetical protein
MRHVSREISPSLAKKMGLSPTLWNPRGDTPILAIKLKKWGNGSDGKNNCGRLRTPGAHAQSRADKVRNTPIKIMQ